ESSTSENTKKDKNEVLGSIARIEGNELVIRANMASTNYESGWIVDSGASMHLARDRSNFSSFYPLEQPVKIRLADKSSLYAHNAGSIHLRIGSHTLKIIALHAPDLENSLLSVDSLMDAGHEVRFGKGEAALMTNEGEKIRLGKLHHGIITVEVNTAN